MGKLKGSVSGPDDRAEHSARAQPAKLIFPRSDRDGGVYKKLPLKGLKRCLLYRSKGLHYKNV